MYTEDYEFWKMSYDMGCITQEELADVLSLGGLTQEEYDLILNSLEDSSDNSD